MYMEQSDARMVGSSAQALPQDRCIAIPGSADCVGQEGGAGDPGRAPMNDWTQDVLGRLTEVSEPSQVLEQISAAARCLGFEHCAYGLRVFVPFTRPETLMLSTYDERWNHRYIDAGYLEIDPTVLHGVRSRAPTVWSDELFRGAARMWDEARSFGLRVGWAQSVFEADARVGMLSLARSSEPLTAAEMRAKDPLLQ